MPSDGALDKGTMIALSGAYTLCKTGRVSFTRTLLSG